MNETADPPHPVPERIIADPKAAARARMNRAREVKMAKAAERARAAEATPMKPLSPPSDRPMTFSPDKVKHVGGMSSAPPPTEIASVISSGALQNDGEGVPLGLAGLSRPRKPFGTPEAKLAFPEREGYKRRVFNDTPGRIQRALEAGYTHVLDEMSRPTMRIVDRREGGGGLQGYLMEIPEQFYNEDFALKQANVDETDKVIYRGKFRKEPGDADYVPSEGIKVSVERGRR